MTKPGKGCGDKNHLHERRFECQVVLFGAQTKEGKTGTTGVYFLVTLSASPLTTVTVDYTTLGGTATAGTDFIPTTGTITFGAGVTTQTVTVQVVGDALVEPNETFYVRLSNPSPNAYLGNTQATGKIVNDDG